MNQNACSDTVIQELVHLPDGGLGKREGSKVVPLEHLGPVLEVGCSRCGITGIHACPGRPLPTPTPEDEARVDTALDRIFGKSNKEPDNAMLPDLQSSPQGEDPATP